MAWHPREHPRTLQWGRVDSIEPINTYPLIVLRLASWLRHYYLRWKDGCVTFMNKWNRIRSVSTLRLSSAASEPAEGA